MSQDIFSFRYFTFDPARPECAGFYAAVAEYEAHVKAMREYVHSVAGKLGIEMKDWSYGTECKDGICPTPITGVIFYAHSYSEFSVLQNKFGRDVIVKNISRKWADDGRVATCRFRKKSAPQIECENTAKEMGVKGTPKELVSFVGKGCNWLRCPGMRTLGGNGPLSGKPFLIHCDQSWTDWTDYCLANGGEEVDAGEASRLVNEKKADLRAEVTT